MWKARLPLVWLLALATGLVGAYAMLAFRHGIGLVQWLWLGTEAENIVATKAAFIHPLIVFSAPVIGGLVVGALLVWISPKRRAEGVADIIEDSHLRRAMVGWREGLSSAIITIVSLGSGASTGSEGPAVHIGSTIASQFGRPFRMPVTSRRLLLAAGAAAAVSASFNAPVAGVVFAHEVILGHYALSAFVPTVLASVTATLIIRAHVGDFPAFIVPPHHIVSNWEFPAFALLGLISGLVAVIFLLTTSTSDRLARRVPMPLWLRPAVGGALLGLMALFVPQILGIGYEATSMALKGKYGLYLLLVLLAAKILATSITLASRFGGGVFAPSLFMGAMAGGAFGTAMDMLFTGAVSQSSVYALVGMGAVAGAILGAPLSTALIVFEMTGGYQMTIALLLATSLASLVMQTLIGRSFFHWQLATRGLNLDEGPHRAIMKRLRVRDFMTPRQKGESTAIPEEFANRPVLHKDDTLEKAMRAFARGSYSYLPVCDRGGRVVGWADYPEAIRVYNEHLVASMREQHE